MLYWFSVEEKQISLRRMGPFAPADKLFEFIEDPEDDATTIMRKAAEASRVAGIEVPEIILDYIQQAGSA